MISGHGGWGNSPRGSGSGQPSRGGWPRGRGGGVGRRGEFWPSSNSRDAFGVDAVCDRNPVTGSVRVTPVRKDRGKDCGGDVPQGSGPTTPFSGERRAQRAGRWAVSHQ